MLRLYKSVLNYFVQVAIASWVAHALLWPATPLVKSNKHSHSSGT